MKDASTYAQRVQRVVDNLAEHLDDKFDLEALASQAHFSPYHFHRIYRGLLGETVYDTIRRLRLRRAALDLLDEKLSIERTARRAGFTSQAAFTGAFRAEYGDPPARYRGAREARANQLRSTERYITSLAVQAVLFAWSLRVPREGSTPHSRDRRRADPVYESRVRRSPQGGGRARKGRPREQTGRDTLLRAFKHV